jgi:hypothetical protein
VQELIFKGDPEEGGWISSILIRWILTSSE